MSHFSVLVIGNDVEEQLEPFQENNMESCPAEYLEFIDIQDEYQEKWDKNEVEISNWYPDRDNISFSRDQWVKLNKKEVIDIESYKDNVFLSISNGDRLAVTYKLRGTKGLSKPVYASVSKVEQKENNEYSFTLTPIYPPKRVKIQDVYKDFEEYCKLYHGSKVDSVKGRHGYWENPDAKWDWYEIGGRWTGFFKLVSEDKIKYPELATHGRSGLIAHDAKDGTADQVAVTDIDLVIPEEDLKKSYRFWEVYVEGAKKTTEEKQDNFCNHVFYKKEYYIERYKTKENYAKATNSLQTYAVLRDGEWIEQGSMGWFGCSSETHEEAEEWSSSFYDKFIKDLPEETLLTVVDCHI